MEISVHYLYTHVNCLFSPLISPVSLSLCSECAEQTSLEIRSLKIKQCRKQSILQQHEDFPTVFCQKLSGRES